jgi:hypothetical protein
MFGQPARSIHRLYAGRNQPARKTPCAPSKNTPRQWQKMKLKKGIEVKVKI